MSGYYDHLSALVSEKLSSEGLPNHSGVDHFRLEEALSSGVRAEGTSAIYSLRIGKVSVDISECVARASSKLNEYIDRMVTTLGDGSLDMISSVVLAGGGARLLRPAVNDRLGNLHEIVTLENSQFAIANGYAHIGAGAAKRTAVAA